MPDTLVGLILFVALLTPGTVYAFRREANSPVSGQLSPVREAARLVAVSLICDGAVLLGLVALHGWLSETPDAETVLKDPGAFYSTDPLRALAWGSGFLLAACLVA